MSTLILNEPLIFTTWVIGFWNPARLRHAAHEIIYFKRRSAPETTVASSSATETQVGELSVSPR